MIVLTKIKINEILTSKYLRIYMHLCPELANFYHPFTGCLHYNDNNGCWIKLYNYKLQRGRHVFWCRGVSHIGAQPYLVGCSIRVKKYLLILKMMKIGCIKNYFDENFYQWTFPDSWYANCKQLQAAALYLWLHG